MEDPRLLAALKRGTSAMERGDWKTALIGYNEAIEIDPTNATAYLIRANIHQKLGNTAQFMTDLAKYQSLKRS